MERVKNNKIIYLIILITSIITVNVIPKLFPNIYIIFVFLFWLLVFAFLKTKEKRKFIPKHLREKLIYLTFIMIAYYIIYFSLGIMLGFSHNPYQMDLFSIIKNIVLFIGVRVFREYLRVRLVNRKNKKLDYILITLIFATFDLTYISFNTGIQSIENFIEYFSSIVVTAIARSAVLTYLAKVGGSRLNLVFCITYSIVEFITPLLPKLDWFVLCAKDLLLCLTIYLFINNIYLIKTLRMSKRDSRKYSPTKSIPAVIILILFVSFMVGLFEYKPIAVMSYSMYPEFSRGDVLIIKEFDKEKPGAIKVGDIIQYRLDGKYIVHRVVKIDIDYKGNFKFTTKGDNNKSNDAKKVEPTQIDGVAKFIVPYVGYPSVWFSQFVLNKQPVVETE